MSRLVDAVDGVPIEPGTDEGSGFVRVSTALATGKEVAIRVVELHVGTTNDVRYIALDRQATLELIGSLCQALYINEVAVEQFGR
jgi:hypothetical protein